MVVDTPGCQGEGGSPWRQLIVPLGTNLGDYWLGGGVGGIPVVVGGVTPIYLSYQLAVT